MRLISIDALIEYCEKHRCASVPIDFIKAEKPLIATKHGRWEEVSEDYEDTYYRCTCCGDEWYLEVGNPKENRMYFCPNCGAKMDDTEAIKG